jgi:prepilin-type N-terminal cleavage/methylation domain-containing protein
LNAAARQHGFSFVEIMVALVLLAICIMPMGEAIRNGLRASTFGVDKARELRCMRHTMETVLAEPFQKLSLAARNRGTPSGYPLAPDAVCAGIARTVSINWYEREAGKGEVFLASDADPRRLEDAMLYVTVSSGEGGYAFTRLVTR